MAGAGLPKAGGFHGTAEPLAGVLRFIEALVQASKPYDLVLLPDRHHGEVFSGSGGAYRMQAIRRYLEEHLTP